MQLRAGLRNRRKALIISLSHFASFCVFLTAKAKPSMPPFLLLLLLATLCKYCFAKIFPQIQLFYVLLLSFSLSSIHQPGFLLCCSHCFMQRSRETITTEMPRKTRIKPAPFAPSGEDINTVVYQYKYQQKQW